jgi:hypothetical protein
MSHFDALPFHSTAFSFDSTGSSYPHVVDVDWRLDYYIKVIVIELEFSPLKCALSLADPWSHDI